MVDCRWRPVGLVYIILVIILIVVLDKHAKNAKSHTQHLPFFFDVYNIVLLLQVKQLELLLVK